MSSNLVQINPFVTTQWDEVVNSNPSPQFFHYSCWSKVLVDTYNFRPLFFMIPSEQGCTIPMLIVKTLRGKRKAVALPFSDGCDIKCESIKPDQLVSDLLKIAKSEKLDRLEFRGTTSFQPSGEPSYSYWGHRLQLTKDEEFLFKNMASSKQRNVRKAKRENTKITFHNDHASVREFYRLHCMTRKRHGLPPQPVSFFDSIYENIISKNRGQVALAFSGNFAVSGAVFLLSKSEVLYKFGASDKHLQHIRANDLLMWEAILKYSQEGFKVLSFGKTEKFHEGLCRFKEGFGASPIELNDFCYDIRTGRKITDAPSVNGIHNLVFRSMPVPMLRLCGELLYKYSA